MTATYTNQPGTVDIDTVRFEVDDRDGSLLSDEEIQYLIDSNPHILLAASAAASAIAGKYSDSVKAKTVGDLRIDYASAGQAESYERLAGALRLRALRKTAGRVYAGGVSKTDKTSQETDTDRIQPSIRLGMHDSERVDADDGVMDF